MSSKVGSKQYAAFVEATQNHHNAECRADDATTDRIDVDLLVSSVTHVSDEANVGELLECLSISATL